MSFKSSFSIPKEKIKRLDGKRNFGRYPIKHRKVAKRRRHATTPLKRRFIENPQNEKIRPEKPTKLKGASIQRDIL